MYRLCQFCFLMATCILSACGSAEDTQSSSIASVDTVVTVQRDGVTIDYQSCGTSDTTLLFVHGWCIDQSYWEEQVDAFCEDYRVVTIDLPGFGKSGKNRDAWTMEAYGQDVAAVIHQLDLQHVVLIGHSMGGDVILEAALAEPQPVIGFVGVDNFKDVGVSYSEEDQQEIQEFLEMIEQDFANVAAAYAAQALFHPSTDSSVLQSVTNDFRHADSTVAIASLKALFAYSAKEKKQLARLNKKIYLINSDATPTAKEGLEEAGIPYEIVDIHNTGHYPMVEKPETFNQLLGQILDKIHAESQ